MNQVQCIFVRMPALGEKNSVFQTSSIGLVWPGVA
jgi:hypothetical protein